MSATLRVLGANVEIDDRTMVGVFCEKGTLHVGDHVTVAIDQAGERHDVDLEVVEIRFFDQSVERLDEVYSANVALNNTKGTVLGTGWILEASQPQKR